MSPEWLAGFIDGEGCFTIRKSRRSHFTPTAIVTNTDRPILELIQVQYGGTLHTKGARGIHDKPAFSLVWSGSLKVLALLEVVEAFLLLKKSQAAVVKELANHLISSNLRGRGVLVPDTVVAYRDSLKQNIHTLNKRGIN